MHYLDIPFLRRAFNVLRIGGLILLSSCESDPILLNPPGGYDYITHSFQIDTTNVFSIQGSQHTGHSQKLYAGILPLSDSITDTAYVLIRILPELLDTHQICNDPDSISQINISLASITSLVEEDSSYLIQRDSLKIYLLQPGHTSETWNEDIVLQDTDLNTIVTDLNAYQPLHDSLISIEDHSIEVQLYNFDQSIIDDWCANENVMLNTMIISYTPDSTMLNEGSSTYLEFVSSDVDASSMPKLNLEYHFKEEYTKTENRYSITTVESSSANPYYINNDATNLWGTVYVINIENNESSVLEEVLNMESITITENINTITQLDSSISLVEIDIKINSEIRDSINDISFWLSNVQAYISETDPNQDNIETNTEGTENNDTWEEGELFNDYGSDNCQDSLETGDDNFCGSSISIYNPTGTEGNGVLDGDAGEEWLDWGIDGCPDSLETGLDENSCLEELNPEYEEGMDLNKDNYNKDPSGDNYIVDSSGTEGNGIWEIGEQLFDWGSDGLHHELTGYLDSDSTEGNGVHDIGEVWWDYGTDGCKDEFESGDPESPCLSVENPTYPGTEGNDQFDSLESYLDCGIDNICDGEDGDDPNDNYEIDPNKDNAETVPEGTENNGIWNEGEKLFDWGSDGVPDSLEAFQPSATILPELYTNMYAVDVIDVTETTFTPNLLADTVSLWIAKIHQTSDDSLTIQVNLKSHIVLKGLQFQLNHATYSWASTILQPYHSIMPKLGDNNGDNKLFEDITLLAKDKNLDSVMDNSIQINYANDWSASINFDSLAIFLEQESYTFSYPYSQLVMYIDTLQSYIHDDGMWLFLGYTDSDSLYTYISSSADSIVFPIGQIMAGFQNGSHGTYNDLKLMTNSYLYNYSTLSIFYNPEQPNKNPRLDVMYTNE